MSFGTIGGNDDTPIEWYEMRNEIERLRNAVEKAEAAASHLRAENDLLSDRFYEMNLCLIKYEKLLREAREEILGCGNHLKPSVIKRIDAALGTSDEPKENSLGESEGGKE